MSLGSARGFSLVEVIVAVAVVVLVFTISFPLYQDYSKRDELRQGARKVRNEIEFTMSQASAGVVPVFPSPTPVSDQSYWLIRVPSVDSADSRLVRAACAMEYVHDNSCTIDNGVDRTVINLNPGILVGHIAPEYNGALVLYYSPVFAHFTIRKEDGTVVGLESLEVEIRHSGLRLTDKVTLRINSRGKVTESSTI